MRPYPAYKDSGVEWLGEVPEGWEVVPLWTLFRRVKRTGFPDAELLSVYRDFGVVPKASRDGNFNNASEDLSTYQLVKAGDLAINKMKAWQGSVAISEFEGIVSPAYFIFTPTHTEDSRYLHYLMRSAEYTHAYLAHSKGIRPNQWDLEPQEHSRMGIILPPLPEQQAIARFLDKEVAKIDALVAEQRRLIALLAEKRQAVISHAVTKGLNPATPLKPSGIDWLGDIPEGWEVVPLRRLIDFIEAGTSVNATDISAGPEERGVLKTSCVYSGTFTPEENKTVIPEEFDRVSCPLIAGTLVVSRMNTPDLVGAAGYVREAPDNLFLPDRLWQVHLLDSMPEFIHFWTMTEAYRGQVKVACAGTSSSMQNLTQDDFRSFRLAVPPLDEQQAIVAHLKSDLPRFDALTAAATSAISLLQERRAALISAAVTGKIDLRPHFAQSLSEPEIA